MNDQVRHDLAAKRWLSDLLFGTDVSFMPIEKVWELVEQRYPGGAEEFRFDTDESYKTFPDRVRNISRDLPDTPLRQWSRISGRFNLRKGPLDEVVLLKESDLEIVLVLKVHETKETGRRIKVIRQGVRATQWKRKSKDEHWRRSEIIESWFEKPEFDDLHLWGRIRDLERVASDNWQLSECYRPGTKKSPMQGALAREGTYHEEFFGKVVPPK